MCFKRKIDDQCVVLVQTYAAETLTKTQGPANKLRTTQRAMEHAMMGPRRHRKNSNAKMELSRMLIMDWRPRNYKGNRG